MKKIYLLLLAIAINFGFQPKAQSQIINDQKLQIDHQYACEKNLIEVMFSWESRVKLRDGNLVDLDGDALAGVDQILAQTDTYQWFRICDVPEKVLDEWALNGNQNVGEPVYNLNNIYRLRFSGNTNTWELSDRLESLEGILSAKPVPKPVEPPSPPNYQSFQGYLNAASSSPTGIDANYAWTQTGGSGSGITICDLEYSWNYNHADITQATGSQINTNVQDPFNDNNHGTAVIGVLVSDNNGWGTTGICYGSNLLTCGTYYGSPVSWNVPGAIALAISNLSAGDIILLEQQWDYTGSGGYVPVEWWTNTSNQTYNGVYAAIVNAVANGIHVVEAGGNGNINTDGLTWYGNSGAIIVGAGGATTTNDLQRLSFSSYGSRFDLQGWGENVFTTGYGNYYNAMGVNYWFTHNFNGTSSASPVVAGALACAEGYYLANISTTPPSPSMMRNHLATYGTAQVTPPSGNIGPRPDLYSAINNFSPPQQYYDWGDAIDPPYPTLSSSTGAYHLIGTLFMGFSVDPESNGQPTVNADGDDLDGNNDDDGVILSSPLIPGNLANIQVTASASGYLNAWVDFNMMNIWTDPGEQIFTNQPLVAGLNNLSFNIPASATPGQAYARFRITSSQGILFYGYAADGEVEDYLFIIEENMEEIDWGDAPDPMYPTLAMTNGAHHFIDGVTYLGFAVDPEADGQPDPLAMGDDLNIVYPGIPHPPGDEDGVIFTSPVIQGQTAMVDVVASVSGLLSGWIDFDQNGSWGDPGEQIFTDVVLSAGLNSLNFSVPYNALPGITFSRFRFSNAPGLNFNGPAPDGEVEDYFAEIEEAPQEEFDFGDAPDPSFPTLLANNGARHLLDPTIFLGGLIDADPDGQPDSGALGDDNDGNDDEDGITFSGFGPGGSVFVNVTASATGYLNGWIDYNGNGSWNDAGEQVFTDQSVSAGNNGFVIPVPSLAKIGLTHSRFRYSTATGLSYTGAAPDGEVEDYEIAIEGDIEVDIRVFLEGPFHTSNMLVDLNDAGLIPLNQPYNTDPTAIWYYNGTESVSSLPGNAITDWIVVEFRDAPSAAQATGATTVSKQAAFIKNNGDVVGLDGFSPIYVDGIYQHDLYVVIWHRNHLGVMSSGPIVASGINSFIYDFTTGAGKAYLNGQLDLGGGLYGMYSGDCKPDGTVNSTDHTAVWSIEAGNTGYKMGDLNLDGQVDNVDKDDYWTPNTGTGTQIPN